MIGKLESIDSDEKRVHSVVIRLPSSGLRHRNRDGIDAKSRNCSTGVEDILLTVSLQECIGQGSFGTVYRAVANGYPHLALKITTGKPSRLQQELDVLSRVCTLGHLSLPRFEFGALSASGDLLVIGMELCVPSTLHDFLLSTRLVNDSDKLFIGYQVARSVFYVHSAGCIHRDIKLQNFLFDLMGNLKLIDFGLASTNPKPPAGDIVAGTVSFMSPEMAHNVLNHDKRVSVGISADIWSLGIVLISIFTQRNPYSLSNESCELHQHRASSSSPAKEAASGTQKNAELLQRVAAGDWHWPEGCHSSPPIRDLVSSMLVANPADRPTIEAVLQHRAWADRRRTPPAAITAFLGVQDDLFLSNEESCLMRAVAQAAVGKQAASALGNGSAGTGDEATKAASLGPQSPSNGQSEALSAGADLTGAGGLLEGRSSLKVVVKDQSEIDGNGQMTDIYDIRRGEGNGKRSRAKSVRELSEVIQEVSVLSAGKDGRKREEKELRQASSGNNRSRSRGKSRATRPIEKADKEWILKELADIERSIKEGSQGKRADSPSDLCLPTSVAASENFSSNPSLPDGGAFDKPVTSAAEDSVHAVFSEKPPIAVTEAAPLKSGVASLESSPVLGAKRQRTPEDPFLPPPRNETLVTTAGMEEAIDELERQEAISRKFCARLLHLEHQSLLAWLRVLVHEDQDRFHITWLEEEQRRSAAHPHKFASVSRAAKGNYKHGYVCDGCDYVFLPASKGAKMLYYHCSCGRDLCTDCFLAYQVKCTCGPCQKVFPNEFALHSHKAEETDCGRLPSFSSSRSKPTTKVKPASCSEAPPAHSRAKKVAAASDGAKKAAEKPLKISTTIVKTVEGRSVKDAESSRRQRNSHHPAPSGAADSWDHDDEEETEGELKMSCRILGNKKRAGASRRGPDNAPPSITDPTLTTSSPRTPKLKPVCQSRVTDAPEEEWKPFSRFREDREKHAVRELVLPSDEERESILHGPWLQSFYLYPCAEGEEEENTADVLAYQIQYGRTGAMFLAPDFSIHSAVFSMLERVFFAIEQVDVEMAGDPCRTYSLLQAKATAHLDSAFSMLQELVAYDTNLRKQHRIPGTSSVYQAPRSRYTSDGEPFVYVRWFRRNQMGNIWVFLLSHGGLQALIDQSYELRWMGTDGDRIFRVRSNGVCDVVDRSLPIFAEVEELLYGTVE